MKFKHLLAMMAFIPASMIASVSYATGTITSITAPASAIVNTPVPVTVNGSGNCEGGYTIYWGDTTNTAVTGNTSLPHNPPAHTYSTTGLKTISIDAGAGCSGGPTTQIQINSKPPVKFSTISSISGNSIAYKDIKHKIKVLGTGKCKIRVKWGDGQVNVYSNYNLSAPTYLYHRYYSTGFKTIKVTPAALTSPYMFIKLCRGSATKSIEVQVFPSPRFPGGPTKFVPNPAATRR